MPLALSAAAWSMHDADLSKELVAVVLFRACFPDVDQYVPTRRVRASGFVVQSGIENARNTEGHLSDHRFKVGQSVKYTFGVRGLRRQPGWGGVYKITHLLPAEGDERLYRVKSADEPHERVARETELERIT
jgi:hypothetical protein